MLKMLGLDLSTHTGFALLEFGFVPTTGRWMAPDEAKGIYGNRYSEFFVWLDHMHQVHQFDGIAFEKPIKKPTDDLHILRLLIGFAVIVETFAGFHNIPCVEVGVADVKIALTGNAFAKKSEMKLAATRLGWKIHNNDDEADAGAVAMCGIEELALKNPRWKLPPENKAAA